jgi:hypothetical protein
MILSINILASLLRSKPDFLVVITSNYYDIDKCLLLQILYLPNSNGFRSSLFDDSYYCIWTVHIEASFTWIDALSIEEIWVKNYWGFFSIRL